MIRDLTKSLLSFSWGMSLFGATQLVNSLTPDKAAAAFNAVTRATEDQLGDVLKGAFRAGDQLQRGMVDMTFGLLMLEAFNPSQMMKMASGVMQQTTGASGQGGQARPAASQARAAEWGPMPPTDATQGPQVRPAASQATAMGWGPNPPTDATQGPQARPAASQERTTGWGPIPPQGANRS